MAKNITACLFHRAAIKTDILWETVHGVSPVGGKKVYGVKDLWNSWQVLSGPVGSERVRIIIVAESGDTIRGWRRDKCRKKWARDKETGVRLTTRSRELILQTRRYISKGTVSYSYREDGIDGWKGWRWMKSGCCTKVEISVGAKF